MREPNEAKRSEKDVKHREQWAEQGCQDKSRQHGEQQVVQVNSSWQESGKKKKSGRESSKEVSK